jgi:hypothetical protein
MVVNPFPQRLFIEPVSFYPHALGKAYSMGNLALPMDKPQNLPA